MVRTKNEKPQTLCAFDMNKWETAKCLYYMNTLFFLVEHVKFSREVFCNNNIWHNMTTSTLARVVLSVLYIHNT